MKVIAIANQKGGVGKTTTAMNLSHALTLRGQRVLLMDLDSQANCTSGLGIEAPPLSSIYPVLLGDVDIREKFIDSGRENLTFLPSEMDLAGIVGKETGADLRSLGIQQDGCFIIIYYFERKRRS